MQTNERAEAIVSYWLGDSNLGSEAFQNHSKLWYYATPETDQAIKDQFGADLSAAERGELDHWAASSQGMLALVILLDQFSRNLYRGSPDAFKNDLKAQELVTDFIATGQDQLMTVPERLLLYHPLLHAEDPARQKQIVSLHESLLESCEAEWKPVVENSSKYCHEHADTIFRFGRFPHRNQILGRTTTDEELAFLEKDPRDYGQSTEKDEDNN